MAKTKTHQSVCVQRLRIGDVILRWDAVERQHYVRGVVQELDKSDLDPGCVMWVKWNDKWHHMAMSCCYTVKFPRPSKEKRDETK